MESDMNTLIISRRKKVLKSTFQRNYEEGGIEKLVQRREKINL